MLKPTAYLTITLAGDVATSAMASAVKRTYSYIAPVKIVAALPASDADAPTPACSLALDVRLPAHPYLVAGEQADQTWEQVVLPWLKIKLGTVFGSVYEFNNPKRESFVGKIDYTAFDLMLESRHVVFALEPDSSLRDVTAPLCAVRDWLLGAGASLADQVARIEVPSDAQRGDADWFDVVLADGTSQRVG